MSGFDDLKQAIERGLKQGREDISDTDKARVDMCVKLYDVIRLYAKENGGELQSSEIMISLAILCGQLCRMLTISDNAAILASTLLYKKLLQAALCGEPGNDIREKDLET